MYDRDVDVSVPKRFGHAHKPSVLHQCIAFVLFVCFGKMCEHPLQLRLRYRMHFSDKIRGISRQKPQPSHPAVYLDVHFQPVLRVNRKLSYRLQHLRGEQCYGYMVLPGNGYSFRRGVAEHQNRN
ncbi:hypothetical protein D3C75_768300 [compost metagenome]